MLFLDDIFFELQAETVSSLLSLPKTSLWFSLNQSWFITELNAIALCKSETLFRRKRWKFPMIRSGPTFSLSSQQQNVVSKVRFTTAVTKLKS